MTVSDQTLFDPTQTKFTHGRSIEQSMPSQRKQILQNNIDSLNNHFPIAIKPRFVLSKKSSKVTILQELMGSKLGGIDVQRPTTQNVQTRQQMKEKLQKIKKMKEVGQILKIQTEKTRQESCLSPISSKRNSILGSGIKTPTINSQRSTTA